MTNKERKAIIIFLKKFMNMNRYEQCNVLSKLEKELKKRVKLNNG